MASVWEIVVLSENYIKRLRNRQGNSRFNLRIVKEIVDLQAGHYSRLVQHQQFVEYEQDVSRVALLPFATQSWSSGNGFQQPLNARTTLLRSIYNKGNIRYCIFNYIL